MPMAPSTWGQFFIYQGFNEHCGWMHTSSAVDAIDEYLETVIKKGDQFLLQVRQRRTSGHNVGDQGAVQNQPREWPSERSPSIALSTALSFAPQNGKWVSISLMQEPVKALTQSYMPHQGAGLQRVQADDGAARELFEQHDLCGR